MAKVNFEKISREGAIGYFKVQAFECWKDARGESFVEMIVDELRRSPREFYSAKEILNIEKLGWTEVVALAKADAHAAGMVAVDLGEVDFASKAKDCCKFVCGTAYMTKEDYRNVFLPMKKVANTNATRLEPIF